MDDASNLGVSSFKCKSYQFPADLVTFTEEILNGKLHFLCSEICESILSRLKNHIKFEMVISGRKLGR